MAVTQDEVLDLFGQVSAIKNSDQFLLISATSGGSYRATKITAELVRTYLIDKFGISIGDDGYIYIGGEKTDKKIDDFAIELDFDDEPTEGSNKPVKSDGIYRALQSISTNQLLPMLFHDDLIAGSYVRYSDGVVVNSENSYHTGKKEIPNGYDRVIVGTKMSSSGCIVAFYDKEQNYMKSSSIAGTQVSVVDKYESEVPIGAKYVDFSYYGSGDSYRFSSAIYSSISIEDRISEVWNNISTNKSLRLSTIDNAIIGYFYWVGNLSIGAPMPTPNRYAIDWCYGLYRVFKGDTCEVSTKGGTNGLAWTLWDKDRKLLSKSSSSLDCRVNHAFVDVEQDGFIIINHNISAGNPTDGILLRIKSKYDTSSDSDSQNGYSIEFVEPRVIDGQYIDDSNALKSGTGRMFVYKVNPSDKLKLTIHRGYAFNVRGYMILNSKDLTNINPSNILDSARHNSFTQDEDTSIDITVPSNAKLLVCQGYYSNNIRFGTTCYTYPSTNFTLERKANLNHKTFKMLAVGNSFTCDELSYVPYVLKSIMPEVDVRMRILYLPAGSIQEYNENRSSSSIIRDGETQTISGYDWNTTRGKWTASNTTSLETSVDADDWDIITFQQVSTSPTWNSVSAPLGELVDWLKLKKGYTGRIAWLMTHSYSDASAASIQVGGSMSSDEMYELNSSLAKIVIESGLVDILLPSATAIQNLRHTQLVESAKNQFCGGTTSSPDIHLEEGYAPMASSCAAVGAIFHNDMILTRVKLSPTWLIPIPTPSGATLSDLSNNRGVDMSDENQAMICKCVFDALSAPYSISSINIVGKLEVTATGYNSSSSQSTLTISGSTYTEARDVLQNGGIVEMTIEGAGQNFNARMFFSVGYMMSGWFFDSTQDVFAPVVIVWNDSNCIAIKSPVKQKENIVVMLSSMGSMDDSQTAIHVTDGLVYNVENHTIDTKSNNVVVSSEQPSANNIYVNRVDNKCYRYSGGSSGSMIKLK